MPDRRRPTGGSQRNPRQPIRKERNVTDNTDRSQSGRIVVGVDGSEASKDALRWAARQAELTGAALEAVMTWHFPALAYGTPVPMPSGYDLAPQAAQVLGDTVQEVLGDKPALKVHAVVVEGSPALELLDAATDADLLVVGSRGHGAFTGMLLGSVSAHCVAHAPCPVVVVRHSSHPADGPMNAERSP